MINRQNRPVRSSLVEQEAAKERTNVVVQSYDPSTHAILLNASGHLLPVNTFEFLFAKGYKTFSSFSCTCHVNIEEDLWSQALDIVTALGEQEDPNLEELAFQIRGTRFFFTPAKGNISIMLYTAITEMCGIAPELPVIGYDAIHSDYVIYNSQNMPAFLGSARGRLRAALIQGIDSGVTEEKIAKAVAAKAARIKTMPKIIR